MNPAVMSNLAECVAVLDGAPACPDSAKQVEFGAGRSERCVEGPWAARWLRNADSILDIGYALSSLDYLGLLLELKRRGVQLTGVDIIRPQRVASRYPESWRDGVLETVCYEGDIRTVALPEAAFDAVACISTIEHVGFDAPSDRPDTAFARWERPGDTPQARDPNASRDVMQAIARALAPGGVCVLTTPMGRGGPCLIQDSLGFWTKQQEYDAAAWRAITGHAAFSLIEEQFFKNTPSGAWIQVEGPQDLADVSADGRPHAAGVALAALRRLA